MTDHTKSPRLYLDAPLNEGQTLALTDAAHHYLKNVMRAETGDDVRFFNGRDGEFAARIETIEKKCLTARLEKQLRAQKNPARRVHLLFAPIRKERMDFLVEKAVELGATDLHIVLTQNTDQRKTNEDRLTAQIIEAAEQCERLDIPALHAGEDLFKKLKSWNADIPLFAALERTEAAPLEKQIGDCALLIGPSGGFTSGEKERLCALPFLRPASLGDNILRSETAALCGLARLTA